MNYVINVPESPCINFTSGFNSNNITVCNGSAIDTITYDIAGAADLVLAKRPSFWSFTYVGYASQVTTITIVTFSPTIIGRTCTVIINNRRFAFGTTVAVANAADHVGSGLAAKLNTETNGFLCYVCWSGNLVLTPGPNWYTWTIYYRN